MSKSEYQVNYRGGSEYLNVSNHALERILDRSSISITKQSVERLLFRDVRQYNDYFPLDADKLVYCREAGLLGVRKGLTLVTVVGYESSKMTLEDKKFEKIA